MINATISVKITTVIFALLFVFTTTYTGHAQNSAPTKLTTTDEVKGLTEGQKTIFEALLKSHESVLKIHEENASRLGWLMTILPGALFGIAALVAWWLGSNLKEAITNQVLLVASGELKQKQADFARLQQAIKDTEQSAMAWKAKIAELKISGAQLDAFNAHSSKVRDYQGQLLALRKQARSTPNAAYDADLRRLALFTLTDVKIGVKELHADDCYNAAAVAGGLKMSDLAIWYMRAAFDKDKGNPVYESRILRHEIEIQGDSKTASKIVARILELVKHAPPPGCELIYSEAWNIAEHLRRYAPFILAFEEVTQRGATSYAHLITARLYMREGRLGWREHAEKHLEATKRLLANEPSQATWYPSSVRELHARVLELGGEADEDGSIAENSAIDPKALKEMARILAKFGNAPE